ncbi:hypothetical protein [Actinokineospora sp.]|uniref:hypothetical protein n=1 Tax=Actinokineospora sp. TaxID=1872133 RepID=UPI00403818CD
MTALWRRGLAALAVAGLGVAGLFVAPTPARAACAGVTVVVDFGPLGGGVQTGCAGGDPGSGLAALSGAGYGYTFASRQPGFVCRINGKPTAAADACVFTSPTTAYWSYWHGQGGSWSYGSSGAGAYNPAPGGVEGWAFGAGRQPGVAPPVAPPPPPPPPPPKPTTTVAPPGAPGPTTTAARPPATSIAPGQPATTTADTAPPPTSTASTSGAPTTSSPTQTSGSTASPDPVAATRPADSGGNLGLVIGIVVIAAIAALGLWTARRRATDS